MDRKKKLKIILSDHKSNLLKFSLGAASNLEEMMHQISIPSIIKSHFNTNIDKNLRCWQQIEKEDKEPMQFKTGSNSSMCSSWKDFFVVQESKLFLSHVSGSSLQGGFFENQVVCCSVSISLPRIRYTNNLYLLALQVSYFFKR